MKTIPTTRREGELLGPIDYSYDFLKHFESWGISAEEKKKRCDAAIEMLRVLESHEHIYQATTDGGWPRVGWGTVLAVGMYDGWPYWRPVPSVMIAGPLGGEWHTFSSVTGYERE